MSAEAILDRLNKARLTAPGKWLARCPAHDDGKPSLSILERGDGSVLLYCFAGCSVDEIVGAVGLEMRDLFPPPDHQRARPSGRWSSKWRAEDLLHLLDREALIILIVAADKVRDGSVTEADMQRLARARTNVARIVEALA